MKHCTAEKLIGFETVIKQMWEVGELPFLLHLCGGNEQQLIDIFERVQPGDWVFSGHRSHYHYLLSGGREPDLKDKIRSGDSMFVFGKPDTKPDPILGGLQVNFLTSSVLAGTCCIAAGVAWQLKEEGSSSRVWCFLGDGAEDEGHFYEAVQFVHGHGLPCTFIIEDNDRSVDTDIKSRRGVDTTSTDWDMTVRMQWPPCVERYQYKGTYPHAGSGCKYHIKFNEEIVRSIVERR